MRSCSICVFWSYQSTGSHIRSSRRSERFEPHLGHNWLSCGVFLVKSRHFGFPIEKNYNSKLAVSLKGVGRSLYKSGVFTKST